MTIPECIAMVNPECIAMVKDILLGTAAVITAGSTVITARVAVNGLEKWRQELHGKTEFEAARNLLRATYRVRDELQYSRSRGIRASEYPSDCPDPQSATAKQQAQVWSYVYNNRLVPVREALQEFETHVLEAEALWGSEIRAKANSLKLCVIKVQVAMETIIEDVLSGGENFRTDPEFGKKTRSEAYASIGDEKNKLNNEIKAAVNAIEDIVRPHLRR